jgi:hypothetical protein
MRVIEGDILQKGKNLYRVYNVGKDIVLNKVFYNPSTNKLQIYHGYEYAEWNEIGETYILLDPDVRLRKLEVLKRKYKLLRLEEVRNSKNT